MIAWRATPAGIVLAVRAKPHGGRDRVLGERQGALHVAVSAAPEQGKANAAIAEVLAEAFGLPKSAVALQRGATTRDKFFLLAGLDPAGFPAALDAVLAAASA